MDPAVLHRYFEELLTLTDPARSGQSVPSVIARCSRTRSPMARCG